MSKRRMFQVNELLRQEISRIVLTELSNPRFQRVTITSVRTTADLHQARVFYHFHGAEAAREVAQEGLQHAEGRIRHLLGQRLRIKYIPHLAFEYDDRLEYAEKINKTLSTLKTSESVSQSESEDQSGC